MIDEKTKSEIEKFVFSIRKGHDSNDYTQILCNTRDYIEAVDYDKDFLQFPVRIKMEVADFDRTVDNTFLGGQLGEDIAYSEFNAIIKELSNLEHSGKFDTITPDWISDILNNLPKDFFPKFILVPIDHHYYENIHNLIYKDLAGYESQELYLKFNSRRIKVIWSSNYRPFKDIYLLEDKAITWVSKKKKEMKSVESIGDYNNKFDTDDSKLSVVYKLTDNELDFVARTVGRAELKNKKIHRFVQGQ